MSRTVSVKNVLTVVIIVYVALAAAGVFVADFGDSTPEPVSFDDTVSLGLTLEDELRLEDDEQDVSLPQAQVFYSQYPYVVGYWGIEQFSHTHEREGHSQQFGYPMAIYVTVYDETSLERSDESLPITERSPRWYPAEDAVYVVESAIETPAGETAIPFEERTAAETFVESFGGDVVSWEDVLEWEFDVDDAETVRDRTANQHAHADELVSTADTLLERPIDVVVGEDIQNDSVHTAETIQAGIETASPGTTVLVTNGTYNEHVTVSKSVTVLGENNVTIQGDETGTVFRVTADDVAIQGLSIAGVGNETPGAGATEDHAHGGHDHDHGETDDDEEWDAAIEDEYASGDAGIAFDTAPGGLISDVTIDTNASGIMLSDSEETVVRDVTVNGNPEYLQAHMGIVAMRSPGVIQDSTITAGLDGVYTHRADGVVVRNNTMSENRMGIHLMHTSDALLANNTIVDSITEGIFVMTGPQHNGIVGNEIRNTPTAIDLGGSESYVASNVLLNNDLGIQIDAVSSVIEQNVIANNRFGVDTRAMLPTNRVSENNFVGNDRHVARSTGPERIWTHEERGNYWEGAVGTTDGEIVDRQYSPTDDIDGNLHRTDGTPTLAQAPVIDAIAGVEDAVSGMRDGEITDTAPLCGPVHAEWFAENGWGELDPQCGD